MERETPTQFSLLQLLGGFVLLSSIGAYLSSTLRYHDTETVWPFYLSAGFILVLVAMLSGPRHRKIQPESFYRAELDSFLIVIAVGFAVVNGLFMLENSWISSEFMRRHDPLELVGILIFLTAVDCLLVLIYTAFSKPRPALFAVLLLLLIMGSLVAYNTYVCSQIIKSI